MPTVALVMIVRNEAHVIRRCLDSVRPFITCWSICDTGSTDGTQEIILQHMKGVPGTLHQRPWVDQQHNRNESIELARDAADYLLLIDADEELEPAPGFVMPDLTADAYDFTVRMYDTEWSRPQLVSAKYPWRWVGKRHPGLHGEGAKTVWLLPGMFTRAHTDGATWVDPDKYKNHAAELEVECAAEPGKPRLRYYLAQSYKDAGEPEKALANYLQRAEMGGFEEERWSALYEAAKLLEALGRPPREVVAGYVRAFEARQTRAEPLYRAARFLRFSGQPGPALGFAREASVMPRPPDRLFVEGSVYEWRALDEHVVCAYVAGELLDLQEALPKLIERAPAHEMARIARNTKAVLREALGPVRHGSLPPPEVAQSSEATSRE